MLKRTCSQGVPKVSNIDIPEFDATKCVNSPGGSPLWTLEEVDAEQKRGRKIYGYYPPSVGKSGARVLTVTEYQ